MKLKYLIAATLALVIFGISIFVGAAEDEDSNRVSTKTMQAGKPMPQGMGPIAIAITEDGNYAFIGLSLPQAIFKAHLGDLTIEAMADLSEYFPLECEDIALDASEEKLFVYADVWRKMLVLDTQTMNVIHTIDDIGGISGRVMIRSQYGPFLIIWDGGNTVKFVDTETYEVTEVTHGEIAFMMIQESKYDQGQWYVVSGGDSVGIYDYEDKAWNYAVSIPLQEESEVVCDLKVLPNEQKLYVATFGGWYPEYHAYGWLYSIDLEGEGVKVVPIDGGAMCLEASPDSQSLYVGTGWPIPNNNTLLVVDTQSDEIVGPIYLGKNKYGCPHSPDRMQIDPANPHLLYATCGDANSFIKVDLDNLTLADVIVLNEQSFAPHFFVKRPMQATGYILIRQSANAFELDLDQGTIQNVVEFPMIREDVHRYNVAIDDTGRLFIAQGETVLEIDVENMGLLETHPLPPDIAGLWDFVLSNDQTKLYSVWHDPCEEGWYPDTFLAINTMDFQVEARIRLEGGVFADKPYELPEDSKLYALGGQQNGPVVIHVIETNNYTIQKTITFDEPGLIGISAGSSHPFAYDSSSHTLFVGATQVVLAIDTDTDEIKNVIYLGDAARAIGLEPWQLTYINAVGLFYHPYENYLYIAHVDYSFVSIYDLSNDQFLPQVIILKGFFPTFLFANDDHSKIYCPNERSDSISVIDVNSKAEEKVIDLHSSLEGKIRVFNVYVDTEAHQVKTFSNSSISMFNFNQPSKQISFEVKGLSFAFSFPFFCNFTIPNNLLWGNFTVLIDGKPPVELIRKDNATHISLCFSYELQSSMTVQITGTEVIPEFPSFLILPLFIISTLLAAILYRRKHTNQRHSGEA